jgi:hypothetical protein
MKIITKSLSAVCGLFQNKYLYICASILTIPCIAQASEYGQKIRDGVAIGEGLMYIFAGLIALGGIIGTYFLIKSGKGDEAKMVIFATVFLASAFTIIGVVFTAFGVGDAVVQPNLSGL